MNIDQTPQQAMFTYLEKKYPDIDSEILKEIVETVWIGSNKQTIADIQNTQTYKRGMSFLQKLGLGGKSE